MSAESSSSHRQLAVIVAEKATETEREALLNWLRRLLDIRASAGSIFAKARQAIAATLENNVVWPVVKIIARETKRIGWDDRSRTARLGLGGAAVGAAIFGGKSAGVAALGTAIGVPLWVVLGAGAAFANVLVEELSRRRNLQTVDPADIIIEVRKKGDDR